jgi:glycerophosphoryl diester phosphodiesterase
MVFATQILYTTDKMKRNNGNARQRLHIVGHRGAKGLAPENTIAALKKALEYKVDEIEIDVRVTKDHIVVLHHNRDLRDQTTARYDIRYHTYEELKLHKPDLATLEEAIEAVGKRVPLLIEVKGGEQAIPVIRVIQIFLTKGWKETDFLIGSKNQHTLIEMHSALPSIPTVVIEAFSGVRASYRARQIGTKRISMRSWWLWGFFIRSVARNNYQLYAYTMNDTKHARRWHKQGLAGVITDRPDLFV